MRRINLDRQWARYSEAPVIAFSDDTAANGLATIQEVHYGPAGAWDVENLHFHVAELMTPATHYIGRGRRQTVRAVVPSTAVAAPGTDIVGGWRGQMVGRHLFMTQMAVARILDADPSTIRYRTRTFAQADAAPPDGDLGDALFRSLWAALRAKAPPAREVVDHLICALAIHATETGPVTATPARHGSRVDRSILRSIKTIPDRVTHTLTLSDLAQESGVSASYYSRKFRAITGVSPYQYILAQRVDRARALLRDRDLNLAEVALAAGFSDQSQMTATFRRLTGTTPARLRETF